MKNGKQFWKQRSENYNKLEWVKDPSYMLEIKRIGQFKKTDKVLDVGCGTGAVVQYLSPLVKEVTGIDTSQDMLSKGTWEGNKYGINGDIRDTFFKENTFDKITARMVFHHIIENTSQAMNECHRILKKKGKLIIAEGTPPNKNTKQFYIKVFKLKEKRLTFYPNDIKQLMTKSGFKNIQTKIITLPLSINNWMKNSGLPADKQRKIYNLHKNAQPHIKKAYKMKTTKDNDIIIQTKTFIISGTK